MIRSSDALSPELENFFTVRQVLTIPIIIGTIITITGNAFIFFYLLFNLFIRLIRFTNSKTHQKSDKISLLLLPFLALGEYAL